MKIKKVIDIFGKEVEIDISTVKIYNFNNKNKKIQYNAEIIENKKRTGFFTDFIETGVVKNTKDKLNTFGNPVAFNYLMLAKNIREQKQRERLLKNFEEFVQKNEEMFFDEHGDWKTISSEQFKNFVEKMKQKYTQSNFNGVYLSNGIVQFAGGTFPSDATCKFKNHPKAPKISFLDLNKTCIRFSIEYGLRYDGSRFPMFARLGISLFASSPKIQFPRKITLHFYYRDGTKKRYELFQTSDKNVFVHSLEDLNLNMSLIHEFIGTYSDFKNDVLLAITQEDADPNFTDFSTIPK